MDSCCLGQRGSIQRAPPRKCHRSAWPGPCRAVMPTETPVLSADDTTISARHVMQIGLCPSGLKRKRSLTTALGEYAQPPNSCYSFSPFCTTVTSPQLSVTKALPCARSTKAGEKALLSDYRGPTVPIVALHG